MEKKEKTSDSEDETIKKVKIKYRPEWLDAENQVFINKLNKICKTYDKTFEDISSLKTTTFKTHKINIQELKEEIRELRDDYMISKQKVNSIEGSISIMVREMVKFFIDQKFEQRLEQFVSKDEFKERISVKMDTSYFYKHLKKQLEGEQIENPAFKLDEKFEMIDRKVKNLVNHNQLKSEIRNFANLNQIEEIQKNLNRIQYNGESSSQDLDKKILIYNQEQKNRSDEIQNQIQKLEEKLAMMDEELKKKETKQSEKSDSSSEESESSNEISKSKSKQSQIESKHNHLLTHETKNEQPQSKSSQSQQIQKNDSIIESQIETSQKQISQKSQLQVQQSIDDNKNAINEKELQTFENVSDQLSLQKRDLQDKNKFQVEKKESVILKHIQSKKSSSMHGAIQLKKNSNADLDSVNVQNNEIKNNQNLKIQLQKINRVTEQQKYKGNSSPFQNRKPKIIEKLKIQETNDQNKIKQKLKEKDKSKSTDSNKRMQEEASSPQYIMPIDFNDQQDQNNQTLRETDEQIQKREKLLMNSINQESANTKQDDKILNIVDGLKSQSTQMQNDSIQNSEFGTHKKQASFKKKKENKHEDERRSSAFDSLDQSLSPAFIKKSRKKNSKETKKSDGDSSPQSMQQNFSLLQNVDFINSQKNILDQIKNINEKIENMDKKYSQTNNKIIEKQNKFKQELHSISQIESQLRLETLQRKLVGQVVTELLTPIKQNFNVDLKTMRKHLEDCIQQVEDNKNINNDLQRDIKDLKKQVLHQLRDNKAEKEILDREVSRMQTIDRVKVQHAKKKIFSPENKSMLPSFDSMYATNFNNPSADFESNQISQLLKEGILKKDIITRNELMGTCERYGQQPSQRERIIIARSQQNNWRSKTSYKFPSQITTQNTFRSKETNDIEKLSQIDKEMSGNMNINDQTARRFSITQGSHGFANLVLQQVTPIQQKNEKVFLDVQTPEIKDARDRMKLKINIQHVEKVDRQVRLANQLENQRQIIRDKYKLKKYT